VADVKSSLGTVFHCIVCGKTWGSGPDVGSSGVCVDCFTVWAKSKMSCFATHQPEGIDCKFYRFCKDVYEQRQK